jgi:hypothetical protein
MVLHGFDISLVDIFDAFPHLGREKTGKIADIIGDIAPSLVERRELYPENGEAEKEVFPKVVASIFKEGKRVLNLRDYQYFVCLSKSIIS